MTKREARRWAYWIVGIWAESTIGSGWSPRESGIESFRSLSDADEGRITAAVRAVSDDLRRKGEAS